MQQDARGLALTAASPEAAAAFDATILAYCCFDRDTGDHLKRALAADPQMPMAHVLRGYFMMLFATRIAAARAEASAKAAAAAIETAGASPCEAAHLAALTAWARGELGAAVAQWRDILNAHPRDLLALKLGQYGAFYRGESETMRALTGEARASWDESVPGYGFVLGMDAFSLEECGAYRAAEAAGRDAAAREPRDLWGTHAVAHVAEMEDRPEDGLAWLGAQEPHWSDGNNFVFHLRWHRCLLLLSLGREAEVLALYDREVRPESTDEHLDVTNAVSLLWRLEQRGVAVGARWGELGDRARAHLDDRCLVFADLHYLMALAAVGDEDNVARWMEASRDTAARQGDAARIIVQVGQAIGAAVLAHRRGNFVDVVARLLPVRADIRLVGGSHAQRDLFEAVLIDAAIHARPDVARTLLAERKIARPHNRWGRTMTARLGR